MTIWNPILPSPRPKPLYLAIANTLANDVEQGTLTPGTKLPTHRALAERLGVTIGTVSRAYAEARRRGLISGEIGRGTFIRSESKASSLLTIAPDKNKTLIDLSLNVPDTRMVSQKLKENLLALGKSHSLDVLLGYHSNIGTKAHRQAGVKFLSRFGVFANEDNVILSAGAQHGMFLAFSVLASSGDLILTESLTYTGAKTLARLLGIRLMGVEMDENGLLPNRLREVVKKVKARALYITPTLQNPTATVMPLSRRKEIATIAQSYGVTIIEDDTYGFLLNTPIKPITALAPQSSIYITALSKSISPALRIGFMHTPNHLHESLRAAVMSSMIMASPLTAELASSLIRDQKSIDMIFDTHRNEIQIRQKLVRNILGRYIYKGCHSESVHLWLLLPNSWRTGEFVSFARHRGVLVSSSESFAVGHSTAPQAIRISLSAVPSREIFEKALCILENLLSQKPPLIPMGL